MLPIESRTVSLGGYRLHRSILNAPLPGSINLEVTNHCNLQCTHCGHTQYPKFVKGHVDETLLDKLEPHLGQGRIPVLWLSDFGESLVSPKWGPTFARAKKIPGITIGFITNGTLLDRHWDELDHERLEISVSLDGACEETYSHFRGAGHFEKVVRNLTLLQERELSGVLPPISKSFIVVLSQVNVHEMPAIVELAGRLGFHSVVFVFQVFFNRDRYHKESLHFSPERYNQWLVKARERAMELGVKLIHPDPFGALQKTLNNETPNYWLWKDQQGRMRCGVISANCYVKFHGQVEACCVPDGYPLGNLQEDDFADIWYGPFYRRLRHSFLTGDWTPTCQNCNVWQSVDVNLERSHHLQLFRKNGELVSMPQSYRATEVDRQYRSIIDRLVANRDGREQAMSELLRLATLDNQLYEVVNAVAVIWLLLKERDRSFDLLRKAARICPNEPVIKHNLAQAQTMGGASKTQATMVAE